MKLMTSFSLLILFLLHLDNINRVSGLIHSYENRIKFSSIRKVSLLRSSILRGESPSDLVDEGKSVRRPSGGTTVFSQACLIAGTTIGGGFLALPTATAPLGAMPASLGLLLTWIYLLIASFSLRDTFFMMSEVSNKDKHNLSLFRIVDECFGSIAALFASALFLLLINSTLMAQLSKAGSLVESLFGTSSFIGTITVSVLLGVLSYISSTRHIEKINDLMTTTMLVSFVSLIGQALRSDTLSFDALRRANFRLLLPPSMRSYSLPTQTLAQTGILPIANTGPWAIPVFIQLLLYSEVVPLVSSRLGDRKKTGQAIVFGSMIPLLMTLIWTWIAIVLVPYPTDTVLRTTGTALKSVIYDPLTGLKGRSLIASVNSLAMSAIITTALGSILASIQLLQDIVKFSRGSNLGNTNSSHASNECTMRKSQRKNRWNDALLRLLLIIIAIGPASITAATSSADLYYHATSFAGEVPCAMLYGLTPSLCNLRLRLRDWNKEEEGGGGKIKQMGFGVLSQVVLAVTSVAVVLGASPLYRVA